MELWNDLRERLKDVALGPDDATAWRALTKPIAPFDGQGSALVAFGSLVMLIVSFTVAVFSFAGLLVAMSVMYLIISKVFGIDLQVREGHPFAV